MRIKKKISVLSSYILILAFCFIFILPVLSMLGTSLKTSTDTLSTTSLFPSFGRFYFMNYYNVLVDTSFARNIANSCIVSVTSTLFAVAVSALSGYAVSRFKGWFFNGFILLLLLLQMLPSMLVMLPTFLIYKGLGINNTFFSLILCYSTASLAFCTWLLKGFFDTIPFEVEESAMIDGCKQFSSFFYIVLPISLPGLFTVAIFSFIRSWNEYVMARILVQSDSLKTINLGLQKFVQENMINWAMLSAGATIAILPTILFLLFAQKYLVQGLTSGAIKG